MRPSLDGDGRLESAKLGRLQGGGEQFGEGREGFAFFDSEVFDVDGSAPGALARGRGWVKRSYRRDLASSGCSTRRDHRQSGSPGSLV